MLDWIAATIEELGYAEVAWLMLLENVLPPLPSEIIVPLAGYMAASGGCTFGMLSRGRRWISGWRGGLVCGGRCACSRR